MKRVGGRWRYKDLSLNFKEWEYNYKADIVSMWKNRAMNLQVEVDALNMKFDLTTRQGAESIMKNVAKRMLMGEVAQGVIAWHQNWLEYKQEMENQARAQRMMQR